MPDTGQDPQFNSVRDELHDLAFDGAVALGMDNDAAERVVESLMSGYLAETVASWQEASRE